MTEETVRHSRILQFVVAPPGLRVTRAIWGWDTERPEELPTEKLVFEMQVICLALVERWESYSWDEDEPGDPCFDREQNIEPVVAIENHFEVEDNPLSILVPGELISEYEREQAIQLINHRRTRLNRDPVPD